MENMSALEIAIPFVLFVGFIVVLKYFKAKADERKKPVPKKPLGERKERDPVDREVR